MSFRTLAPESQPWQAFGVRNLLVSGTKTYYVYLLGSRSRNLYTGITRSYFKTVGRTVLVARRLTRNLVSLIIRHVEMMQGALGNQEAGEIARKIASYFVQVTSQQ